MEQTMNQPVISWNEYPVIGLFTALMLSILGFSDGFYLVIPSVLFFVLTGVKNNANVLVASAKRYWYVVIIIAGSAVYDGVVNGAGLADQWQAGAVAVLIGGFFVAVNGKGSITGVYQRFWVFLFAIVALGIVKNVVNGQAGYFLSDEADLSATVLFVCITILFVEQKWLQAAGAALSLLSAVILFRRGAFPLSWIASVPSLLKAFGVFYSVIFIVMLICAVYVIAGNRERDLKKQTILTCVTIVTGVLSPMTQSVNTSFLLFLIFGMFMGVYTQAKVDGLYGNGKEDPVQK